MAEQLTFGQKELIYLLRATLKRNFKDKQKGAKIKNHSFHRDFGVFTLRVRIDDINRYDQEN